MDRRFLRCAQDDKSYLSASMPCVPVTNRNWAPGCVALRMTIVIRVRLYGGAVKPSVGDGEVFGGPVGDSILTQRDFFGVALVAQDAGDDSGVQRVSSAVGFDVAEDTLAEQGQIADQVEDLVADELILEAQRRVVDALAGEYHAVLARSATDEAHVQHRVLLLEEAEGSGGGDLADVAAVGKLNLEGFATDQRVREVDGVAHRVAFCRIDPDKLVALLQLVRAQDLQVDAFAALLADASLGNHLDERLRTAVEDGYLEVVELDDGIVDAHAYEGRE